jgi:hypothetical protein
VPILNICCIKQCWTHRTGFYFLARRLWKYSKKNSALYSLQIDLSNEVSLDIPLRLKKKSWGLLRTSGNRYAKTICVKMWARKNKNWPVSIFFTKIAYFQVMNFIPVKVSTLYFSLFMAINSCSFSYFRESNTNEQKLTVILLNIVTVIRWQVKKNTT